MPDETLEGRLGPRDLQIGEGGNLAVFPLLTTTFAKLAMLDPGHNAFLTYSLS